jgi:hypothetical protein
MKTTKIHYLIAVLLLLSSSVTFGQTKPKPHAKPIAKATVLKIKKCHLAADSTISMKVKLSDVQAWADATSLTVICDDNKTYALHQFNVSLIIMSPMQTKDFGTGNDGIPILGRRAINDMKKGDTILLKDVTAKDDKDAEIKLPTIVFSIIE